MTQTCPLPEIQENGKLKWESHFETDTFGIFDFAVHKQCLEHSVLFPLIAMNSFFKFWIIQLTMSKYPTYQRYWSCIDPSLRSKKASAGAAKNLQEALVW